MHQAKEEMTKLDPMESLASLVKRLGNPESTVLLHSPFSIFRMSDIDGVIAYQQIGKCAVVIGDPVCLPQDVAALVEAFHTHCQKLGLKNVYLLTHSDFAHWAIDNNCHTLIEVGDELSIDPTHFAKRQKLRWKVNQSLQQGAAVKEYKEFDATLESQIRQVIDTWLRERRGPQIHLGNIEILDPSTHRIFYSILNNEIVGVLMLSPVDRFGGWVVSSYLALKEAPVGTTEHLMCSCFEVLADENCWFLCLGVVSGKRLGEMIGLNPIAKMIARLAFNMARRLFKLDAKEIYLNKFHPIHNSMFLLCRGKLTLVELFAFKRILNVQL